MTYDLTGTDIKEVIKNDSNMTQAELSIKCGVSKSTVSKWLNDKRPIPKDKIKIIYDYIDVENHMETLVNVSDNGNLEEKYENIKKDILDQLERQNKYGRHYEDLVDHAVYLFRLKDQLEEDIKVNGIRVMMKTGNGHMKETDNASIRNLNNISSQIIRVLKDLGLNDPEVEDEEFDEDDFT